MIQESTGFLSGLNAKQSEAVLCESGAILVLAGAGSGKTKVLTSRIANLVMEKGANPYEILAVTFTNKASKEMKQRLSVYLGEPTVKKMWVGTFHSISGKILRRHLDKYTTKDGRHWDNNFVIYDDTDTKTIIRNAIAKLNLDEKIYDVKLIKSVISNAKNKMEDAHAFATNARDYKSEKISEVYYEYEKQLALNNAIDFDDMLMLTVNLMKQNEEVRAEFANKFKHILVDEFQDTNKTQYEFIKILFSEEKAERKDCSLCAVGDVDQSIYSWRGADYKIILNFQKDYKNTTLIKLEQNYRSTGNILNAANEVIKNNLERLDKNLYSTKGEGKKIKIYEAESDINEGYYIAKKIRRLRSENTPYENIAVLYRTNAQSRVIEEALMSGSIPYKIVGGLRFYERKEIKDIIAYLKLIYNKHDNQSIKRIINVPKRGIGETTLKKIFTLAEEKEISIFSILENIEDYKDYFSRGFEALLFFAKTLNSLIQKQEDYSLSEFITLVMEEVGYIRELKFEDSVESQSRLENLQELVNVAREFESDETNIDEEEDLGMLGNFLSQVALVSDIDEVQESEKSITLMTLHAAKGLEYPIVFLAGLEEGLFPGSRAIAYDSSKSELEEERRLMYVGITRAKEELYLTYARQRRVWGDMKTFPRSRFIDEIPQNLLEEDAQNGIYGANSYKEGSGFKNAASARKDGGSRLSNSASSVFVKKAADEVTLSNNLASSLKNITKRTTTVVKKRPSAQTASLKEEVKLPDFKEMKAKYQTPATKKKTTKKAEKEPTKESVTKLINKCKEKAKSTSNALDKKGFPVGARVFHPTFGVGYIQNSKTEGGEITYEVEFQKHGVKKLDDKTSELKSF